MTSAPTRLQLTAAEKLKIVRLRNAYGLEIETLAERFAVGRETIREVLRRAGFERHHEEEGDA